MTRLRNLLKWLPVLGIFALQIILWQIALVQMAHIHSELNYPTAVDLLDNRPGLFYGMVAVTLLLSNLLLWLWWRKRGNKLQTSAASDTPR